MPVCEWQKVFSLTILIYLIMPLFVYKLIREAKLFCIYCIVLYCIVFLLCICSFKTLGLSSRLGNKYLYSPLFWEEKNNNLTNNSKPCGC